VDDLRLNPCRAGENGSPCGRFVQGSSYDVTQCLACWRHAHALPLDGQVGSASLSRRPPRVEIPCRYLGGEATREVPQHGRGHPGPRRFRKCGIFGLCTVTQEVPDYPCCGNCEMREPDTWSLVAPLGTRGRPGQFQGRLPQRPWSYRVSVCIPHLETIEPLRLVIELLRLQTVTPYIIVVDTGSSPATCEKLEVMRSEDVEIHYVRSNGYVHPSEPVAVALDLGHAACHTEFLYHTHSDCFVRRRDWLEWLLRRCSAECPCVGYEMSERTGTREWVGTPSHTSTMLHMPTMRRIGMSWSMQRWYEHYGVPPATVSAWPDTEAGLRLSLDLAGITPMLIDETTCPGAQHERNYTRDCDVNVDHVRSFPSRSVYGTVAGTDAEKWMHEAMLSGWNRVMTWRKLAEADAT
jgi:hypothetical protein